MMHCRYLASCSRMQISSLSLTAVKHVPSLYMTAQDSPTDMKLTSKNLLSTQHISGHNVIGSSGQVPVQKIHPACQPKTLSTMIFESFLIENGLSQFSDGSKGVDLYKCPSRHADNLSNVIILDNVASITSFYDCPVSSVIDKMKAPSKDKSQVLEGPGRAAPEMEAKIIMKIRHKKMKKHKLKKLRKRMYFLWHKQKLARKARRMKIYNKELEEIKKTGEDFNAVDFVKEQLAKAKKGGYSLSKFG